MLKTFLLSTCYLTSYSQLLQCNFLKEILKPYGQLETSTNFVKFGKFLSTYKLRLFLENCLKFFKCVNTWLVWTVVSDKVCCCCCCCWSWSCFCICCCLRAAAIDWFLVNRNDSRMFDSLWTIVASNLWLIARTCMAVGLWLISVSRPTWVSLIPMLFCSLRARLFM